MKKFLFGLQKKHTQKILDELEIVFYRVNRYQYKYTLALFYSEENFSDDLIGKDLRMTDKIVTLEDNLFLLIFENTDMSKGGIIATEKLLQLLFGVSSQDVYCSVEECVKNDEGSIIIHRLFTLINYAIEHKHKNEIIDTSYLDGIY